MKKQEFLPRPQRGSDQTAASLNEEGEVRLAQYLPHYNALNASVLGEKISARKGYVYVR